jgi:hypothetical protein
VCCLQTKEGKVAEGVTSEEFAEVMGIIRESAEFLLGSPEERSTPIMYSWDNDRVHKGAHEELEQDGWDLQNHRMELPELSSDMHKVIEHIHAQLQCWFEQWLQEREESEVTVEEAMQKLDQFFYDKVTWEAVTADVLSLKKTYKGIIAIGGRWPAKPLR